MASEAADAPPPELVALAEKQAAQQPRLREAERQLQGLLGGVERALAEADDAWTAAFLRALKEVLSLQVRMAAAARIEIPELRAYPTSQVAAFEGATLELQLRQVALDVLRWERFAAWLADPESAGEAERAARVLASDGARRQDRERFALELPALRRSLDAVLVEAAALPDAPAERLAALKALRVPALAGEHYRLAGILRRWPEALRFLETWDPKVAPGAAPPKRALTDRLRSFLGLDRA